MADWGWENGAMQWNEDGTQLAVMLEAWDNKDRWIATVDFAGKKLVAQDRLHDDAWINYTHNEFGWLNTETLWFMSEADGYSHLYVKPLNGDRQQLTAGDYVVETAELSRDAEYFYFQANIDHPGIYEVYRVKTDGSSKPEALTDLGGMTAFELSPTDDQLLLTHSTPLMPPELYHKSTQPGDAPERQTFTVSENSSASTGPHRMWSGYRQAMSSGRFIPHLHPETSTLTALKRTCGGLHSRCRVSAERPSGLVKLLP